MAKEEHAQKQIREDTSRVKLARYYFYDTSCLVIEDQSQYQGGCLLMAMTGEAAVYYIICFAMGRRKKVNRLFFQAERGKKNIPHMILKEI